MDLNVNGVIDLKGFKQSPNPHTERSMEMNY